MENNIRDVITEKNINGEYQNVRIVFGPHYMVEIKKEGDKLGFSLVATHHGFKADASKVNGSLENIINEIREKFSRNRID
jgi:hypothetical protein